MAKKAVVVEMPQVPKLEKFLSGYSNTSTRNGYRIAIEKFLRCVYGVEAGSGTDYNALFARYLVDGKRNYDDDFQRFADHLIANHPVGSAKQIMTFARYVLNYHGITISKGTSQDIRRETKGDRATVKRAITRKIIADALQHCDVRARALFLCLASSGSRLNEMLAVNINDCDFESRPAKMVFRGDTTKTKKQRYTYISDEAVSAVKEWLKVRSEYIGVSNSKSKKLIERGLAKVKTTDDPRLFPFSDAAANKWWSEALNATGQLTKDAVTGRNQLSEHGFRAFFISQMSLVISKEIPEYLAGHAGYLTGAYRIYNEETTAAEYLKGMHMVSVTGAKQIAELESELKKTITEQSVKTEKHADALAEMFMENSKLRKSVTALECENKEMQAKVQKIEAMQELMLKFISDETVLGALESMSDDGGKRLHEKLNDLMG